MLARLQITIIIIIINGKLEMVYDTHDIQHPPWFNLCGKSTN